MRKERPRPPEGIDSLVRREASELLAARFPHDVDTEAGMSMSAPIPVTHLALDALQEGRGLDAGSDVGWRVIIVVGGRPVALADAAVDENGNAALQGLNYGPYVASLNATSERAKAALDRHGGELEILSVPALYLMALWHDADDGEGTVTVLAPAPPEFEAGATYPEDAFVDRLVEVARSVTDPPNPPDDIAGRTNARP